MNIKIVKTQWFYKLNGSFFLTANKFIQLSVGESVGQYLTPSQLSNDLLDPLFSELLLNIQLYMTTKKNVWFAKHTSAFKKCNYGLVLFPLYLRQNPVPRLLHILYDLTQKLIGKIVTFAK